MTDDVGSGPASITVRRPLDWMDTDAAGIWHWTSAFRHIEAAEHAMHQRLDIARRTFGWSPRVRVEVDFLAPVSFGEEVVTQLRVTGIGRSSITYRFELSTGERPAARGSLVTVIVDDDGAAVAVPDEVRAPLLAAGDVTSVSEPAGTA